MKQYLTEEYAALLAGYCLKMATRDP